MTFDSQLQNHDFAFIDGFLIDCLLSDHHTLEAEVTEFPVESGSTIADNIRPKPISIAMECIVSNTPLGGANLIRPTEEDPSTDAYAMLLALRKDRRLCVINTSLGEFTNMALESLSIPRAGGRGDELRFNATFKQVDLVENRRGIRVATPAASSHTSENKTLTAEERAGVVLLDKNLQTWFDASINGWRDNWVFDLQVFRQGMPSLSIGKYLLFKGRPLDLGIGRVQYAQELLTGRQTKDYDVHSSARLRRRVIAAQGGKPRPALQRTPFLPDISTVIHVSPNEYRFSQFAS